MNIINKKIVTKMQICKLHCYVFLKNFFYYKEVFIQILLIYLLWRRININLI